ncbi:BCAN [Mytilus edulis]|uniref:BCAN n=1 Tax=Mytilus edulis TaxID=6550 RepID=A0A8S3VBN0_MYTED|nr:BCAN [Mytilus edulis]
MFNCWYVIVIALSIYNVTNAEKLTHRCKTSQGRCAQTKDSNCEISFGSGWTEKGSCCRGDRVACCEDIPTDSLKNGSVIVTERNTGSTANFSCDAGLSLVGRQSIICTASGWNGNIPQCIKIVCPETVAFFRGSKYIFKCTKATWSNSEANCKIHGGHLTSVETGDENTFLVDVIRFMRNKRLYIGNAYFWIGASYIRAEMSYKWLSGQPLNYSNWYPGQPDLKQFRGLPNAFCALIHYNYALKWGDEHCQNNLRSVCEIRFYEDLAYSVMTEMYWKDNSLARQLLVTEVKRYNSTTVFEISEKFALMKFIGHAACQTKLNKIWKGHIFSETSTLKIVTAAFIPILIMQIVRIKDNRSAQNVSNMTPQQTTESWRNRIRKLYYFYNSPVMKFVFSLLAYMAMLVIFSMFVLTDLYPIPENNPSVMEYMFIAWAVTTLTEEIRQHEVFPRFKTHWTKSYNDWKNEISNKPESEQLAILERYSVYRHLNSSIRLRRYHATNTEAEKDGFDTSYTQEADISLEEQFDLLTSEVYKMQKKSGGNYEGCKRNKINQTESVDNRSKWRFSESNI